MESESRAEDPLARTNSGRSTQAGISQGRAHAAFNSLLAFLHDQINSSANGMIERAEQSLPSSSQPATSPPKPQGNIVRTELYQRLLKALTTPPKKKEVVAFNEMQMLGEDSMRVALARARLVSMVTERSREDLIGLRMRLNTLQQAGVYIIPQALSPGRLADGFLQTLADLQVPLRAQAMMLEAFGERGVELQYQTYRAANQLLIQHGVLPDFLITNLNHSNYPRFLDTTNNRYELEKKFLQLQEALCELSLDDWRPGLLRRLMDTPPRYTPTDAQQQIFILVEASFIEMMRDEKISGRILTEIHRLVLPLLTIHLTAPEQAAAPGSPVPLFMRLLTMLGHRDRESPLHEFESIKIVVGRVVSEYGREIDSFHVGSEVLFTLSKNEVKRRMTGPANPAVVKVSANSISVEDAKQRVTQELRTVITGLALPPAVQQFVLKLMAPWLTIRLHRYGEDSVAWIEAKTWAAAFFDVLRPADNEEEFLRRCAARRFVLQQVKLRTERSSLLPSETETLLCNLEYHFDELDYIQGNELRASSGAALQ